MIQFHRTFPANARGPKIKNGFQLKEKRLIFTNTKQHHQLSKEHSFRYHQKLFKKGQVDVALSRAIKINNFFLIGKYSPNVFKVNENTVIEYSTLRENLFDIIYIDHVDCNSLTVSLLNKRSLVRHAEWI